MLSQDQWGAIRTLHERGVGKTHLAVGLGLKAIAAGYRVLFTSATALIATVAKARGPMA
jgi:DNA replication protein DnaC